RKIGRSGFSRDSFLVIPARPPRMAEVPKLQEHFSARQESIFSCRPRRPAAFFLRLSSEPKRAVQKREQGRAV
ncbi:MAG TPA: hypothetical protein VFL54_06265, partial [Gammaproteobacteria bacterium]|nr:hypothetical protein [Gammaproteobacteria bacterium]